MVVAMQMAAVAVRAGIVRTPNKLSECGICLPQRRFDPRRRAMEKPAIFLCANAWCRAELSHLREFPHPR